MRTRISSFFPFVVRHGKLIVAVGRVCERITIRRELIYIELLGLDLTNVYYGREALFGAFLCRRPEDLLSAADGLAIDSGQSLDLALTGPVILSSV